MELLVGIVAVGLGIATAAVAKAYNREPVLWGVFGALVFIIALPVLLLVGRRESPADPAADLVRTSPVLHAVARHGPATFDTIVELAGGDGDAAADDIDRLLDRDLLTAQGNVFALTATAQRRLGASPPPPHAPGPGSVPDRLRQLDRLRADGLVDDHEYAQQRARILSEL